MPGRNPFDNPQVKDTIARGITAFHTNAYRWTGGRIGHNLGKVPTLLLTTTGRKSGQPRTTPLLYLEHDGGWVVVASYGGDDRDPQWFKNLQSQPQATVQITTDRHTVTARVATAEEKATLWPKAVAAYPGYEGYQRKTERDIPLVILTPT